MTKCEQFIQFALSQVGVREDGYNHTPYNVWYGEGYDPAEWCDIFVSYCADKVGVNSIIGKFAYVPYHVDFFKKRGEFKYRSQAYPKPGCIVFFGDSDHVGIVTAVPGNYFKTVEGNAGANTDRVVENSYSVSSQYVMGYGFPDWDAVESTTPIYYVWFTQQRDYKNGSTDEPVYADSACTIKIGSLNPYETVKSIGTCDGLPIVYYPVDGERNTKIGFVRWVDGLK